MVDLQTVIEELNTGKIEFDYKDDDCCTTEGEVVILLKRLAELENADVVEVKHGKWVDKWDGKYANPTYICSICGEKALYEPYINELTQHKMRQSLTIGCPHCLAKMDSQL